jgi:KDO2-lipid IV(A) lauroyltransferase
LLPDQAPSVGEGVWAPFFGRPAYTITLAARLARSTGATVLMPVGRRLPAARGYELEFHPLPDPLPDDPALAARAINAAVEAVVTRDPGQYLWSYNRYKQPAGAPPPPDGGACWVRASRCWWSGCCTCCRSGCWRWSGTRSA